MTYQHLELVYDSAFLETAEGGSLDQVVALVGVTRLPAGHPVAKVAVRAAARATAGRITVPAGTVVTDDEGSRYLTQDELTLEPARARATCWRRGRHPARRVVDAGALDRLEVLVAGIAA